MPPPPAQSPSTNPQTPFEGLPPASCDAQHSSSSTAPAPQHCPQGRSSQTRPHPRPHSPRRSTPALNTFFWSSEYKGGRLLDEEVRKAARHTEEGWHHPAEFPPIASPGGCTRQRRDENFRKISKPPALHGPLPAQPHEDHPRPFLTSSESYPEMQLHSGPVNIFVFLWIHSCRSKPCRKFIKLG